MKKKGLSPIVTILLFLILTVTATITIQNWFTFEQSKIIANIESNENLLNKGFEIFGIVNNELYLNSRNEINISRIEINKNECFFDNQIILGIESINISSCMDSLFTNIVTVKIFTNNNVIVKSISVKNIHGHSTGEDGNF